MMRKQQGFTLIELVAVIVILGALAVVALPRFINLQDEAQEAALDGVAGSAAAAHAVNLAGSLADDGDAQTITNCNETGTILQSGAAPNGYTFQANAMSSPTGTSATCTVTQDDTSNTETFTGYYVSG